MVKNRATKLAARTVKSEQGVDYPRALDMVAQPRSLSLVLGQQTSGALIHWNCLPAARNLSIQGPAGSGKTSLLRSLAAQASAHADVYACFAGSEGLAGLKGSAIDATGTWELLLRVRRSVAEVLTNARNHAAALVPGNEPRNSLVVHLARQYADIYVLPHAQRPRQAIVFIDNFDELCRTWEWDGADLAGAGGPESLVAQLAKDGRAAGISIVVAGRSLNLARGTDLRLGERFLLGPATLAEREAFLYSEVASLEIGLWEGIFEPGAGEPVVVQIEKP